MSRWIQPAAVVAFLLLSGGRALGQSPQTATDCWGFSDLGLDDLFPSQLYGTFGGPELGIEIAGRSIDRTSPKSQANSNFRIANGRDDTLRVRILTRDCSALHSFELRPGRAADRDLPRGAYMVAVDVQGQGEVRFRVAIESNSTSFSTRVGSGYPIVWSDQWSYRAFDFYVLDRRKFAGPDAGIAAAPIDGIAREIAAIRDGRNSPMPAAQAQTANLGGRTSIAVENGTQYALTVFLSGPVSQRVEIPARGTLSVQLTPGVYEIAARVSNPSVLPFYGKETFASNTEYSEKFYIATRP